MVKRVIKKILHWIYLQGKFEDIRILSEKAKNKWNSIAIIHPSVVISTEALIGNDSKNRQNLCIDARTRIMGNLFVFYGGGEISIGEDCFIGPGTRISSAKKIRIGNRVLIAHNVNIHDNISHPIKADDRHFEYIEFLRSGILKSSDIKAKDISIEDDVWIGFNSIILKGVTIGRGAIIGAGSLVTKDIEPWTVNVGNPLRCISKIEPIQQFPD